MKIGKIYESDNLKRSKKVDALKKILHKLEKKEKQLEIELKDENSKKKRKKLETKLKINKRHRHKAKKFISELE